MPARPYLEVRTSVQEVLSELVKDKNVDVGCVDRWVGREAIDTWLQYIVDSCYLFTLQKDWRLNGFSTCRALVSWDRRPLLLRGGRTRRLGRGRRNSAVLHRVVVPIAEHLE